MKWFFVIIIVLNLLVFSYGQLQKSSDTQEQPPAQINADKVTLLSSDWKQSLEPKPAELPASDTQTDTLASSEPIAETGKEEDKTEQEDTKVCYQWGKLNERLLKLVKGGLPGLKLSKQQLQTEALEKDNKPSIRYIIYYPSSPQENEQDETALDLASNGFHNSVITSGEHKGNISLGIFTEESNANKLVQRLNAAGFHDAKVVKQQDNEPKKATLTQLSFNHLTPEQMKKLQALQQQMSPGIPLKVVPCESEKPANSSTQPKKTQGSNPQ